LIDAILALFQSPSPMEDERAQIVTWLRREGEIYLSGWVNGGEAETHVGATLKVFADAIERGEHLATIRGESKP
jgi:hypothetical protein